LVCGYHDAAQVVISIADDDVSTFIGLCKVGPSIPEAEFAIQVWRMPTNYQDVEMSKLSIENGYRVD
jgi:hypothetical protein